MFGPFNVSIDPANGCCEFRGVYNDTYDSILYIDQTVTKKDGNMTVSINSPVVNINDNMYFIHDVFRNDNSYFEIILVPNDHYSKIIYEDAIGRYSTYNLLGQLVCNYTKGHQDNYLGPLMIVVQCSPGNPSKENTAIIAFEHPMMKILNDHVIFGPEDSWTIVQDLEDIYGRPTESIIWSKDYIKFVSPDNEVLEIGLDHDFRPIFVKCNTQYFKVVYYE